MNLSLSAANLMVDKVMIKLREYLKAYFGDRFDEAYLKLRELNPSKQSKYGLVPPLLELALFAHFNDKTRGQFEEINVMKLSRNFNKHFRNVFEQNSFEYDFEAQASPSIQHPEQVSKILSGLFGPS